MNSNDTKMVKLCNAGDQMQAELLIGVLRENHIPSYSKKLGSGEYMAVSMGFSIYGIDLYVPEKDKEKALGILEEFQVQNVDSEELSIPWYQNKRIAARILLGFLAVFCVLVVYSVFVQP